MTELVRVKEKFQVTIPASLRMPDAIHVATASLAQAHHFVSGDAGIRTLPEGMQRVQV